MVDKTKEHGNWGHETRDIYVGKVALAAIALVVLMGLGAVVAYLTFDYLVSSPPGGASEAGIQSQELPPLPRLQVRAVQDLDKMREAAEERLSSYGWADRKNGLVRIPIDRAMDLILDRGLPVWPIIEDRSQEAGSEKDVNE
jgi:hypothetical protein